jgi:hypothetical protein
VTAPDDERFASARDIGLVHAWMAWERATTSNDPTTGDITTTTETGTYGVGLTDTRADRLRWLLLADARALTNPQPDQG